MMRIRRVFAVIIFSCACMLPAAESCADDVKLKNGNSVKGTILSTGATGLKIELSDGKAVIVIPIANIDRVIAQKPDYFRIAEGHYFSQRYEQAYELFMKAIGVYGGFDLGEEAYFKAAECQVKMGNTGKAIGLYVEFLDNYPGSGSANKTRLKLAALSTATGDYNSAIKAYEGIIKSKEEAIRPEAYYGLADTYFAKGEYEQALYNYLKVEVLYYEKEEIAAAAKFRSGECYEKLGKKDKALAAYKELIEEYPRSNYAKKAELKTSELGEREKKNGT